MSTDDRTQLPAEYSAAELDDVFTVLADWRRRAVVDHLSRREDASVSALAARLAAADEECTVFEAEIALLHDQLPRMRETGVVRFDEEERRCALADDARAETLVQLLSIAREAT